MPLLDLEKLTAGLTGEWPGYLVDWDQTLRAGNYPETARYNYLLAAAQLGRYLDEYSPNPEAVEAAQDPTAVLKRHVEAYLAWMIETRSASTALNKALSSSSAGWWMSENDRLLKHGDEVIGGMLSGAPVGDDGVWPSEVVQDLLNVPDSDALAGGFVMGVMNNQGTTVRGAFEGGGQEHRRAIELERDAALIAARWPRTAAVLTECARSFRRMGARHDDDAEDTQDEF